MQPASALKDNNLFDWVNTQNIVCVCQLSEKNWVFLNIIGFICIYIYCIYIEYTDGEALLIDTGSFSVVPGVCALLRLPTLKITLANGQPQYALPFHTDLFRSE